MSLIFQTNLSARIISGDGRDAPAPANSNAAATPKRTTSTTWRAAARSTTASASTLMSTSSAQSPPRSWTDESSRSCTRRSSATTWATATAVKPRHSVTRTAGQQTSEWSCRKWAFLRSSRPRCDAKITWTSFSWKTYLLNKEWTSSPSKQLPIVLGLDESFNLYGHTFQSLKTQEHWIIMVTN